MKQVEERVGGTLKFLLILVLAAGVGCVFWLTLAKGGEIAGLGRAEPVHTVSSPVAGADVPSATPTFSRAPDSERPAPSADRLQASASTGQTSAQGSGGVYKWVDEKGTVHFSDRPINPGDERIQVEPLNTLRSGEQGHAAAGPSPGTRHSLPPAPPRRKPEPADYEFSLVGGFQQGDDVILSGRVAGPECGSLRVVVHAKSSRGRQVSGSTVVKGVDPGSRLFKFTARAGYQGAVPRWEVAGFQGVCLD